MRRAKLGFTLVETAVVTSIITVCLSLGLPAMQQARNQARLTACTNNLKQLGLACHNYHDTFNKLPPGWVIKSPMASAGPGFGWGSMLLPYVDQAALYNQLVFTDGPQLNKLTQLSIPVYLCPEDTGAALNSVRGKFALSNYSASSGDELLPGSVDLPDPGTDAAKKLSTGLFFHNSSVSFHNITDGLSNTVMLGEKSVRSAAGIWVGVRSNQNASDSVTDCNHRSKMNSVINSFSSLHGDGANFVLADGRVRFIKETVESKDPAGKDHGGIYQKLANKADGQTIGEY